MSDEKLINKYYKMFLLIGLNSNWTLEFDQYWHIV